MIAFSVEAEGVKRKFRTLATTVKQLDKPLRTFGGYLKSKARARFAAQGPGWPALAQATMAAREDKALAGVEKKLARELKRAKSSSGERAILRRAAILAEFQKRHKRGGSLAGRSDVSTLTAKQAAKLEERVGRALAKAAGKPILGRLVDSLVVEVKDGTLTVESRVKGRGFDHSGIHNKGGTAGRGAKIPARPFLFLESGDLDHLEALLRDEMLLAFR